MENTLDNGIALRRPALFIFSKASITRWMPLLLLFGLLSLTGRFDWGHGSTQGALRSYLANAYLFLWMIPLIYGLIHHFFPKRPYAFWISVGVTLIYAYPHFAFPLFKLFDYQCTQTIPPDSGPLAAKLNWLNFSNLFNENFPGDKILFLSLTVIGCLAVQFYKRATTKEKVILCLAWGLILIQAWMHLSMRAPYTYLPHFESASDNPHDYLLYMFPNRTGAVNQDYYWHQYSESLFTRSSGNLPIMFGRVFPAFILSPFILYFHPLLVWIAANILLWAASSLCLYYLAKEIFGKETAIFAALLMISAQGMINYVAQPLFYIFVHANLVFIATLYYRFFIKQEPQKSTSVLFGIFLGLCSLTYELSPWYLCLFLFSLTRPKFKYLLLSLFMGFVVYQGFYQMARHLPMMGKHDPFLGGSESPGHLIKLIFIQGQWKLPFQLLAKFLTLFPSHMYHAFSLTLFPALIGATLIARKDPRQRLVLFLLLPGMMIIAAMVLLNSDYYLEYPRMVYGNFVGVYLLCAYFLAVLGSKLKPQAFPFLGKVLAWGFILANAMWMNLDVFGHPNIYFHWFYRIARYAHIHPLS